MVNFRPQDFDQGHILQESNNDQSLVIGRVAARRAKMSVAWTNDALGDLTALGPMMARSVLSAALPSMGADAETIDQSIEPFRPSADWPQEVNVDRPRVSRPIILEDTRIENTNLQYKAVEVKTPSRLDNLLAKDYEMLSGSVTSDVTSSLKASGANLSRDADLPATDFLVLYRDATPREKISAPAELVVLRVLDAAVTEKETTGLINNLPTLNSDIEY